MGAKSIQAESIHGVRIYRRLVVHVYSISVKNTLFIAVIKLYLCLFLYLNILLNIYFSLAQIHMCIFLFFVTENLIHTKARNSL